MKRLLLLFTFFLTSLSAQAQTLRIPVEVLYDRPSLTITTGTADTAPTLSTAARQVQVEFRFGTVVGTYTTCTVQAKTSIDGTNYLTIGNAVAVTVTTGTATAWTLMEPSATTASATVANTFGRITKFTFACSVAYGTSAPVTVSVIYSPFGSGATRSLTDAELRGTPVEVQGVGASGAAVEGNPNLIAGRTAAGVLKEICTDDSGLLCPYATTTHFLASAATTNATSVKASAGSIYYLSMENTTATIYYMRLYNLATAPTCSSATGFVESIAIPPYPAAGSVGGYIRNFQLGQAFTTGIAYCITGGSSSTDNTAAATGLLITTIY